MNCAELLAHLALDYLARCDCARHHLLMLTEEDRLHRPPAAEASWPLCEQRGLRLNKIVQLWRANKHRNQRSRHLWLVGNFVSERQKMDFLERFANSGPHFEGRVPETVSTICVIVAQTFRKNVNWNLQNYCLVKKIIAAVTPLKLCLVPLEQCLVLLVSSFQKAQLGFVIEVHMAPDSIQICLHISQERQEMCSKYTPWKPASS